MTPGELRRQKSASQGRRRTNPKHSGVDLGSKAPSCAVHPSKPRSASAGAPIHEVLFPDGPPPTPHVRRVRASDDAPTRLHAIKKGIPSGNQGEQPTRLRGRDFPESRALPLSNKGLEIVSRHRFVPLPPASHLDQNALSRRRGLRIDFNHAGLVTRIFRHGSCQIHFQITRRPTDHMVVLRLNLNCDTGCRICQFQRQEQRFVRIQGIDSFSCGGSCISAAVQEKAADKTSVFLLGDFREHLVVIGNAVSSVYRQDFKRIRILGKIKMAQVFAPIRSSARDNAIPEL